MLAFIGRYSLWLALVAFVAYVTVGVVIPLLSSKFNKNIGMTYRENSGALSGYVLDSMRGLLESIRYNATNVRLAGDNIPIGAYAAVLVIAALAIAGGIYYKKKRKNSK